MRIRTLFVRIVRQFVHDKRTLALLIVAPVFVLSLLYLFFAFFFVFLIAGVSFLRERTSGTLERLLASPVRRFEIVIGYICGFGFFTALQTIILVAYAIYVLDLPMNGSFWPELSL